MMIQEGDQDAIDADNEVCRQWMEEKKQFEEERKQEWESEKKWRISLGIPLSASRFHAAVFADIKEDCPDRQWDDYIKTAESLGW